MNMDDVKSQIINSVTAQTQPQINDFFSQLNSQLQWVSTVVVLLSVLWVIFMLITAFHRWRQHAAIMRIDKNLQKLVAAQVPAEEEEPTDTKQKEQK